MALNVGDRNGPVRLAITLPAQHQLASLAQSPLALSPDGRLLIYAARVDDEVARNPASDEAYFAVADNGTLAYVSGAASRSRLLWVADDGSVTEIGQVAGGTGGLRLSPDVTRIALAARSGGRLDIWSYDVGRGVGIRLTSDDVSDAITPDDPVWMADGERLTITIDGNLHAILASGVGTPERLLERPQVQRALDWSTDGQILVFGESDPETNADIWVFSPVDGSAEPLVASEANEGSARLSSGADWVAYVSDETGSRDVYVQPVRTPGPKVRVSGAGGVNPVWAANDETLFYRSGAGLVAVALTLEPTFVVGEEQLLISGPAAPLTFDVAPDGQRFLMASDAPDSASGREVRVVLNWFEELVERVPTP